MRIERWQVKLDADGLLCQGLIWLLLAGYVAIVYVGVVAAGTLPFEDPPQDFAPPWWLNLLAFITLAVTFVPVYRWVRGSVRALIYSHPENPYPALAQLNRRLEASPGPDALLPAIVESIARMLKLPYVEAEAQAPGAEQPLISAHGSPPREAAIQRVPLTYSGLAIGELRVAARQRNERLSDSELALLHDLARHVGIALYAAHLSADLQRARERLVIAREEERRRIRNDLHDGLAPTLSALQLQLGALRHVIHTNPEQAEATINELREDLRSATAEIRRLVYDLRPPMLDELGLVGAIKSFKFPSPEMCFEVIAPAEMPALSAAIEVAVYRIASEAIHNVIKHAQASECVVTIAIHQDHLELRVADDGKQDPQAYRAGVGFNSMKERAAELGGALSIQTCTGGGTCVVARLPIMR